MTQYLWNSHGGCTSIAEQLDESDEQDQIFDNFKRRVIFYIESYVVKKFTPRVGCEECKAALANNDAIIIALNDLGSRASPSL